MSALGQKRTFALHQPMSALPPKATSNATFGMSAKGQKRTSGGGCFKYKRGELKAYYRQSFPQSRQLPIGTEKCSEKALPHRFAVAAKVFFVHRVLVRLS